MAAGRVLTGFSDPWVALYSNLQGTITYTSAQQLARGVSVSVSAEAGGDDDFWADNVKAESAGGRFSSGTVSLVVDGLLDAAEKLVRGLPTPTSMTVGTATVDVYEYGAETVPPYLGVGWIERWMSDGAESYTATMLTKVKLNPGTNAAATQAGDTMNWQTTTLEGPIMRDDSTEKKWKRRTKELESQADALAALKVMLGVTSSNGEGENL